jgi:phosphatidylglycerophosphatase A
MSKYQSDNLKIWDVFRGSGFPVKVWLSISTWFGTGLIPMAPGTFGTLAATPLVLYLGNFGIRYRVLIFLFVAAMAIWSSGRTCALLGEDDPPQVVIDEVAGFLLTMISVPYSWFNIGLGFVLFRFFDILKPFPVRRMEGIGGGLGIVMDDLMAGVYACVGVRIVLFVLS